ncbi:cytidine deaminase [Burkholderia humptydooensis MSMB43]|uniref:Cytidine deaminase n=1 Tax=Burkholderia humptydooensis MSMB43 TaxID=441157 RepID=A0ABN0G1N5_9BURK|nr:cytidine deaminase [Burkholderia humptydooensis MSMB43]
MAGVGASAHRRIEAAEAWRISDMSRRATPRKQHATSPTAAQKRNRRTSNHRTREHDMTHHALIEAAKAAREKAYAPYSNFKVGAALATNDGKIFHGCNVENASYGLCNCAERTALFSALAAGYRPGEFAAIAVVGETDGPIAPCGACRQVMIELGTPTLEVVLANMSGDARVTSAGDLLPDAFYLK